MRNRIWAYNALAIVFWLAISAGCAPTSQNIEVASLGTQQNAIVPPKKKKLVAVAGFENRSAYAADRLWDTCSQLLSTRLIETGCFRVVEWEKMKQLFDWDALSTSILVKSPERRSNARKILLCEYFLTGAVTYFDVNQSSHVSALSKRKVIKTTVRVDLLLQDAQTGEYLSAATGEATERQEFKGGMLGGKTGTWDPGSANTQ
jgi:curli biogenesis system outer membrane secretion channel CsgG